jgi:hypothetical protein
VIPRRIRTEEESVKFGCHGLVNFPKSCSSAPVLVASSAEEMGSFESAMILNNFKSIATLAHMYVEG